tara:strand:- start:1499 stop:1600 length:102 start_codon:yes stop_codon:yes gene_type:complete
MEKELDEDQYFKNLTSHYERFEDYDDELDYYED